MQNGKKDRTNGMRRRMAALPALCLTGTLVLSGGWSQTAMASAVSEDAADTASETDAEAQTPDQPDSADHTDHSDAAGAPEEQLAGTDHGDASQNADESGQTGGPQAANGTDGAGGTDQPQDAQTPETDESQNPQTPETDELQNPQTDEAADGQEEMTDEDEAEDPALPEQQEEEEEKEEQPAARYEGITIDGDFSDWDAVAKVSVNENKGWDTIDEAAMVWDGDYIYLYFMAAGDANGAGNWTSVCGAGPHNNGQYVITTDLGRMLLIQLKQDGTVGGIDGAHAAINNKEWFGAPHMWEVAIPSDELPQYNNTISFGLYQGQTFVSDVANLQGNPDAGDKMFEGITYDGLYGDWEYYPHQLIQYATSGTQEHVDDAEAAMYSSNGKLYAHVVTNMPAHLQEAGGEFTAAVTIRINSDKNFYPQFVAVDAAGNINYNAQILGLASGTYEFYMIDSQGWKTATNISQFGESDDSNEYGNPYHNAVFGRMYVTVSPSEDHMEYEVDLTTLAAKFGMEPDNIETLHGQWGRIGQQWVTTAGTPTGAGMGLFLCLSTTGIAYLAQRKRKKQV